MNLMRYLQNIDKVFLDIKKIQRDAGNDLDQDIMPQSKRPLLTIPGENALI